MTFVIARKANAKTGQRMEAKTWRGLCLFKQFLIFDARSIRLLFSGFRLFSIRQCCNSTKEL